MGCLASSCTASTVPSAVAAPEHVDVESLMLTTSDGLHLEAELRVPDDPWGAVVLAHPLPTHGGDMHSIVPAALFQALPPEGVATLRFNFRGVGASDGAFDSGRGERLDIVAAIDALHAITEGLALIVTGWSFGADTALCVDDERLAGWCAIAPPLRDEARPLMVAARESRPKLLAIAEHDQFRPPDAVTPVVDGWTNTQVEVVRGADHFFLGRTERLAHLALGLLKGAMSPS
jgi:alpha/beta superfamily hydrolase